MLKECTVTASVQYFEMSGNLLFGTNTFSSTSLIIPEFVTVFPCTFSPAVIYVDDVHVFAELTSSLGLKNYNTVKLVRGGRE
jgi:hypothetical protein